MLFFNIFFCTASMNLLRSRGFYISEKTVLLILKYEMGRNKSFTTIKKKPGSGFLNNQRARFEKERLGKRGIITTQIRRMKTIVTLYQMSPEPG